MRVRGKKFSFAVVNRKLPTGMTVKIDLIEHPGAVLIVPLLARDKIILLRQYRAALGRYLLELPAGTLDPKESPLRCAKRELIEETDFKAGKMTRLGKIYPVPGYSTEVIYIYRAQQLTAHPGCKDRDEVIHPRTLTKREVRKLFAQGQIQDAKTIVGLTFCGWL